MSDIKKWWTTFDVDANTDAMRLTPSRNFKDLTKCAGHVGVLYEFAHNCKCRSGASRAVSLYHLLRYLK